MFNTIKDLYKTYIKGEVEEENDEVVAYRSKIKENYDRLQKAYEYKEQANNDYYSHVDSYNKNILPLAKAKVNDFSNDEKVYAAVMVLNHNGEMLLLKRSSLDDFQPGTWCFPSGGMDEEDNNPYGAAIRELKEETGLEITELYPVHEAKENGAHIYYYLGYLESMDEYKEIVLDKEHESYDWVYENEIYDKGYNLILNLGEHIKDIQQQISIAYNSNSTFAKAMRNKWDKYFDNYLETLRQTNKNINNLYKTYIESVDGLIESVEKGLSNWRFKYFLENSLGVPRKDMPQIDKDNLDDFILHFQGNSGQGDTKVRKERMRMKDIKMTQGEIDEDKVLNILLSGSFNDRYIVSSDKYLLDGHHNFAGQIEFDPEGEAYVYKINLPIKELLRRSKLMKIARKEDINSDVVKKDFDKSLYKTYINKSKSDIPNYRKASSDKNCGNCGAFSDGYCKMFDVEVQKDHVCDEWVEEYNEDMHKGKKAVIGEVRRFKDGLYKKYGQGDWRPYSESNSTNKNTDKDEAAQNFDDWFGDSKIVDENGKPKVVYHGSNEEFDKFAEQKTADGFFFTDDKEAAEGYGDKLYQVYLKMENPADLREPFDFYMNLSDEQIKELQPFVDEEFFGDWDQFVDEISSGELYYRNMGKIQNQLMSELQGVGFDGVIMPDAKIGGGIASSYIVFEPTQIKSAESNTGEYDETDSNIHKGKKAVVGEVRRFKDGLYKKYGESDWRPYSQSDSKSEEISKEEVAQNFNGWFGNSKVVDENGKPKVVYHGTDSDIEEFDKDKGQKWAGKIGFWFSDDSDYSETFGDNVMPVYLKMEKPKIIDQNTFNKWREENANNKDWWESKKQEWINEGHDGLYVEAKEEKLGSSIVRTPEIYAVFEPTQIKSAEKNSGEYDESDPNIHKG